MRVGRAASAVQKYGKYGDYFNWCIQADSVGGDIGDALRANWMAALPMHFTPLEPLEMLLCVCSRRFPAELVESGVMRAIADLVAKCSDLWLTGVAFNMQAHELGRVQESAEVLKRVHASASLRSTCPRWWVRWRSC